MTVTVSSRMEHGPSRASHLNVGKAGRKTGQGMHSCMSAWLRMAQAALGAEDDDEGDAAAAAAAAALAEEAEEPVAAVDDDDDNDDAVVVVVVVEDEVLVVEGSAKRLNL